MSLIRDQQRDNSEVETPEIKPIKVFSPPTSASGTSVPPTTLSNTGESQPVLDPAQAIPQENSLQGWDNLSGKWQPESEFPDAVEKPAVVGFTGGDKLPEQLNLPGMPAPAPRFTPAPLPSLFTDTRQQGLGVNFSQPVLGNSVPTIYAPPPEIGLGGQIGNQLFTRANTLAAQQQAEQLAQANRQAQRAQETLGKLPNVPSVDKPWYGYVTGFLSDVFLGTPEAQKQAERGQWNLDPTKGSLTFGRQGAAIGGLLKYGLNLGGNIVFGAAAEINKSIASGLQAVGVDKKTAEGFTRSGFLTFLPDKVGAIEFSRLKPENIIGFNFDSARKQGNLILRAFQGDEVADINDPKSATETNTGRVFFRGQRKDGQAWYEDPLGAAFQIGTWFVNPGDIPAETVINAGIRKVFGRSAPATKVPTNIPEQTYTNVPRLGSSEVNRQIDDLAKRGEAAREAIAEREYLRNRVLITPVTPGDIPYRTPDGAIITTGTERPKPPALPPASDAPIPPESALVLREKPGALVNETNTNIYSQAPGFEDFSRQLETTELRRVLITAPPAATPTKVIQIEPNGQITQRSLPPAINPYLVPPTNSKLILPVSSPAHTALEVGIGTPRIAPILDTGELTIRSYPEMIEAISKSEPKLLDNYGGSTWAELKDHLSNTGDIVGTLDLSQFNAVGKNIDDVFTEINLDNYMDDEPLRRIFVNKDASVYRLKFENQELFDIQAEIYKRLEGLGIAPDTKISGDKTIDTSSVGTESLEKYLESHHITEDIVKNYAESLAKMHSRDIVHHDLNNTNVIITKDGKIKFIDFDTARFRTKDNNRYFDEFLTNEKEGVAYDLTNDDPTLTKLFNDTYDNVLVRESTTTPDLQNTSTSNTPEITQPEIISKSEPSNKTFTNLSTKPPTPENIDITQFSSDPDTARLIIGLARGRGYSTQESINVLKWLEANRQDPKVLGKVFSMLEGGDIPDAFKSPGASIINGRLSYKGNTLEIKSHPLSKGEPTLIPLSELKAKAQDLVNADGSNSIGNRLQDTDEYLQKAKEVYAPEVLLKRDGTMVVTDGRHRIALFEQAGLQEIPVVLRKEGELTKDDLITAAEELAAQKLTIEAPLQQLSEFFDETVDFGRRTLQRTDVKPTTADEILSVLENGGKPNLHPSVGSLDFGSALRSGDYSKLQRIARKTGRTINELIQQAVDLNNNVLSAPQIVNRAIEPQYTTKIPTTDLYHGTAINNWTPSYNLSLSGSRGELGSGLYLTKDAEVATQYAKARMGENANPATLDLDIDEPGVYKVSGELTSTLDARASIPSKSDFFKELYTALPTELVPVVKKTFSKKKNQTYSSFLTTIENSMVKAGIDTTEDTLQAIQEGISSKLRDLGYDSVYDAKSGFALALDNSTLKVTEKTAIPVPDFTEATLARYNADAYASKFFPERPTTDANLRDSSYKLLEQLRQNVDDKLAEVQDKLIQRLGAEETEGILSKLDEVPDKPQRPQSVQEIFDEIETLANDLCGA